jgi:EmrB/QacA subfamily drug resistance transporter
MILWIIALSFFMESLDSTIINTAIPAMSHALSVSPVDLKLALISYLLSLAIFIPISGWLADKWGAKRVFITALFIFTLSSLWCGFAPDLPHLVVARFVQGCGGAFGLPVGRLIILRTFGRERLIGAMSRVIVVGAMGIMLGPTVGGIIVHYFTWHWIFWVNIPVGLMTLVLAIYQLPHIPPISVLPLDKIGFILFGFALAGITFGFSAMSQSMIHHSVALSIMGGSVFILFIYIFYARGQSNPIVKMQLLRFRTFRIAVLGNLISRLGFGGVPFTIPLLLQVGLGYSPEIAGLLLVPIALGILLARPIGLPLLRWIGYKRLLMVNTLLAGLSIWFLASITANSPYYQIECLMAWFGCMMTLQYSAMNSLAYADIPVNDLSAATSIMGTLQQLSQSFGVALSAIFIQFFSHVLTPTHQLTPMVFHYTLMAIGTFTMLSMVIFIQLKPEDGHQMI